MSDTPRTDEIVAESAARASAERGFGAAMGNLAWYAEALLALARTLERELGEKVSALSDVTNKVREIHQVMKRGEATKDHGLDGNLACILDHACAKHDPESI